MEVIDFQIQIFFKQKRDTIVKYFAGKPGWCVHFLLFSFSANCNLSHKKVIDGRKKEFGEQKRQKKKHFGFSGPPIIAVPGTYLRIPYLEAQTFFFQMTWTQKDQFFDAKEETRFLMAS